MTTFDKRTIVAAAAMLAFGAAYAQTASPAQPGQSAPAQVQKSFSGETFSRLDANKDGMISREEAQADPMVRDAWSKLDPQNAGRVSREDFDKYGMSLSQGIPSAGGGSAPTTTPK